MNRSKILQLILGALSHLDIHPKLIEELVNIIVGSGYETRFFKLLITRLEYLSRHCVDAVKHEEFENIGKGLYSMHLSKQGFNIRILYSFLPNGAPSLLACFHERAGKRKTDYTTHIDPALMRLNERKEVFENAQ
jgi:hypothetical protein